MRCSLKWLAEYVDLTISPAELAERMTMAGVEMTVEPRYTEKIDGVITARIVGLAPHPKADRLTVCTVDTGAGEAAVVCGAPNVRPGLVSLLALPGARIAGGRKVEKSLIREVESWGMLLAEDELGLSEDHTGLMELKPSTPPGLSLSEVIDLDDQILEADLTPNRGDCASVIGLAREAAALMGQELKPPAVNLIEEGPAAAELVEVIIHDPDLCPRYAASLISDLKVGRSPWWMRQKLLSGGLRPINNLVDVTNFILLELNQPLHAFDYERLAGGRIEVRRAKPRERFVTLDGQTRILKEGMLLICDGEKPVALAGVMGGLNSEVEESTSRVLIEAAYFNPTSIRRTSTSLNLPTEAAYRFQRGIDPVGLMFALKRATQLMSELGGGRTHPGVVDAYPQPLPQPVLELRVKRANEFLGTELSAGDMANCLRALQIEAVEASRDRLDIRVPPWRPDLTREVDLYEEVARIHGYDNIPVTIPPMTGAAEPRPALDVLRDRIRPVLAAAGLYQIITYSFIPSDTPGRFGWSEADPRSSPVKILNPLSEELSVLRTSLLYGLLSVCERNLRHRREAIRIFEWGAVFFPRGRDELPKEEHRLAALISGPPDPAAWYAARRVVDFWDIKGVLEKMLNSLGIKQAIYQKASRPELKPGAAAEALVGDESLGFLGQMDDQVLAAFDLKEPAFVFDLSADQLLKIVSALKISYQPLPRFPAITRDLAIVVERSLETGLIMDWAAEFNDPLIVETTLFDVYQGEPLEPDKKSVGLRVRYLSPDKTLTEEEINPRHERLVDHLLKRTGGSLRK